jgi:hypothetical protein
MMPKRPDDKSRFILLDGQLRTVSDIPGVPRRLYL